MTKYQLKDMQKFSNCNKLITRGALGSSSHKYRAMEDKWDINTGHYNESDIVGISVNGNRPNRVKFDEAELLLAIEEGVTFVTDTEFDRSRPYNIGEREIAEFLTKYRYKPKQTSNATIWTKF